MAAVARQFPSLLPFLFEAIPSFAAAVALAWAIAARMHPGYCPAG